MVRETGKGQDESEDPVTAASCHLGLGATSEKPPPNRVKVRVRVRFVFCSFRFSFTEYIHAASVSMWCEREIGVRAGVRGDYLMTLHSNVNATSSII